MLKSAADSNKTTQLTLIATTGIPALSSKSESTSNALQLCGISVAGYRWPYTDSVHINVQGFAILSPISIIFLIC